MTKPETKKAYKPDQWLVVKVADALYKVFGVWGGGYLHGDQWRLNSGIEKVERNGLIWTFYGYSGSVYEVRQDSYGSTAYGWGVLDSVKKQLPNLQILTKAEFLEVFENKVNNLDTPLKEIEITWLSDSHDCDTCGLNWADGAIVVMPDSTTIELIPEANCYESTHYNPEDVYNAILKHLGYSVRHEINPTK